MQQLLIALQGDVWKQAAPEAEAYAPTCANSLALSELELCTFSSRDGTHLAAS
jgi:hypothetical protein